jgi:SAM-dependent methyltransferase
MHDLTRPDFYATSQHYDQLFGPTWPSVPCRRWEYVAAVVFSEIALNVPEHRSKIKVCDAGSGSRSRFTHYIGFLGFETHGFDIGIGGTKNLPNGNHVTYHSMSMVDIKFPDNHFHYVFSMSAIEHVNASPKFTIPELPHDTGDTWAMLELCRILKPGGVLVLTTDYAKKYVPPPGVVKDGKRCGCHRAYSWEALLGRLINPAIRKGDMQLWGGFESECDWDTIEQIEPVGMPYTEFIFTLKKSK